MAKNNKTNNAQTNTLSILSLVFGILFFIPIAPILAIVFGFIALRQIKHGKQEGKGMAITGIVLGFFWIAIYLLIIIFFIFFMSSILLMAASMAQ